MSAAMTELPAAMKKLQSTAAEVDAAKRALEVEREAVKRDRCDEYTWAVKVASRFELSAKRSLLSCFRREPNLFGR